jgi:hypothetical protein
VTEGQVGRRILCSSDARRHLAPRTRLVMDFIWEQVRQVQAELARASDEGELRKRRADAQSLTQSH